MSSFKIDSNYSEVTVLPVSEPLRGAAKKVKPNPADLNALAAQLAQVQRNITKKDEVQGEKNTSGVENLKFIKEFEGGKLYKAGEINVLDLKGTYKQMGRQYGALLGKEMKELYSAAIEGMFIKMIAGKLMKEANMPAETAKKAAYEKLKNIAYLFHDKYPENLKKMFDGMAETSGIEKDKLVMLDHIITFGSVLQGAPVQCSALSAWGDYTGGPMVVGRNFDYFPAYGAFGKYLSVVSLTPNDSNPVALISYPGQCHSYTYIGKGSFLSLNDGSASGGKTIRKDREVAPVQALERMLNYNDIENLCIAANSDNSNYPFIDFVVSKDKEGKYKAVVIEQSTTGTEIRTAEKDGAIAATNYFMDPDWKDIGSGESPTQPKVRQQRLQEFLEKNKGKINLEAIMSFLDTPFEKGGVTWDGKAFPAALTIYQVVYVPETMELRLKVQGSDDWTKIDLKELSK